MSNKILVECVAFAAPVDEPAPVEGEQPTQGQPVGTGVLLLTTPAAVDAMRNDPAGGWGSASASVLISGLWPDQISGFKVGSLYEIKESSWWLAPGEGQAASTAPEPAPTAPPAAPPAPKPAPAPTPAPAKPMAPKGGGRHRPL